MVTLASARQACRVPMSCMGPRITDQSSSPLTYHTLPTQGKPMRQVSSSTWAAQNAGTKGEESKPTWALLVALSWQVTHGGLWFAPCPISLLFLSPKPSDARWSLLCFPRGRLVGPWEGCGWRACRPSLRATSHLVSSLLGLRIGPTEMHVCVE